MPMHTGCEYILYICTQNLGNYTIFLVITELTVKLLRHLLVLSVCCYTCVEN